MILASYELQIVSDDAATPDKDRRCLADLPVYLEETEENLTDILPEGYRAEIVKLPS